MRPRFSPEFGTPRDIGWIRTGHSEDSPCQFLRRGYDNVSPDGLLFTTAADGEKDPSNNRLGPQMSSSATGISWYHRRDYKALRAIFVDVPETYDEWQTRALELERQALRTGSRVIRVYVDPIEFPKWCEMTGNRIDASGRVAYGSAIAAQTLSNERAASTKKTKSWKMP